MVSLMYNIVLIHQNLEYPDINFNKKRQPYPCIYLALLLCRNVAGDGLNTQVKFIRLL